MTPAINQLKKQKITFRTLQYTHDPVCGNYGLEAVEKLALDAEQVFKTLVVALDSNKLVVAIVPVNSLLDLKSLAKAANAKKANMAEKDPVIRSTGYVLGGVSPFGQKKRLAAYIDSSALGFDEIFVSAGKRGLEVGLSPQDLITVLNAKCVEIAKSR